MAIFSVLLTRYISTRKLASFKLQYSFIALAVAMGLFCLCVMASIKPIVPWTVIGMPSGKSFSEFFSNLRSGRIETFEKYASQLQGTTLLQSMVGQTKENLVAVDADLSIEDVCRQFGSFTKLVAEKDVPPIQQTRGLKNAFQVLMAASHSQAETNSLPARISSPRNKKDRLYNDILALFVQNDWKWTDGGSTHGKNFIQNMCDALWYLDGHHDTLKDRSCPIPEPFSRFVGYNVPEKSRHRKRKYCNLNYSTLVTHVSMLQESLLCSWMQQARWCGLKEAVQNLTTSLDDYCTYMRIKNREVTKRHNTDTFFSSDSGTVTVLKVVPKVSVQLSKLDKALQEKPCYEKLCVVDFCSIEPKKKYVFVQDLKQGLTSPAMLYTCSLGSNLGNYDFVWRLPQGVTLEAATNDNIRVIDDIKKSLPNFHSRALKRHFKLKYGRLVGGAKPHILYKELTGTCTVLCS